MRVLIILAALLLCSTARPAGNLGRFAEVDLCRAAIATLNGHGVRATTFRSASRGETTIHYHRPADGKYFQYACKIESTEIRWRDTTMPKWNSSMSRITFGISADGSEVTIRLVTDGDERNAERRTFRKDDFR